MRVRATTCCRIRFVRLAVTQDNTLERHHRFRWRSCVHFVVLGTLLRRSY